MPDGSTAASDAAGGARDARDARDAGVGRDALDVLVAYVPCAHTEAVLAAVFAAGAGAVGDYRECAFVVTGRGRFRTLPGADPTIGAVGEPTIVDEDRFEVVLPRSARTRVVAALLAAHPYEQPAYHVIESAT